MTDEIRELKERQALLEKRIQELGEQIVDLKTWAKGTNMNYNHWYGSHPIWNKGEE